MLHFQENMYVKNKRTQMTLNYFHIFQPGEDVLIQLFNAGSESRRHNKGIMTFDNLNTAFLRF